MDYSHHGYKRNFKNQFFTFLFILLVFSSPPVVLGEIIPINPKSTFLRTHNDSGARNCIPKLLADLGISEGDHIILKELGDFSGYAGGPDNVTNHLLAVFSASNVLLPSYQQHRVPDAIDAGTDYVTFPTFHGNIPTDIPEDFRVYSRGTEVQVPQNAQYLFVATTDVYFEDNSDPDGDYAVEIILPYLWTADGNNTSWDNPDNWNHPPPPSENTDIVVFDLPDSYTVTGYSDTIGSMTIQNGVWYFEEGNVLELTESISNSLEVSGGFLDFYTGHLVTKKAVIGNEEEGQMILNPNTTWDAYGITIGDNAKGELGVFGAVVNDNEINVGGNTEGYLRVIDLGTLNLVNDLAIGRYSTESIGFVWASGLGTEIVVGDFISIGMVGIGNFVVEDGAYVSAHDIGLGNRYQGFGSLFVKENGHVKADYYINVNDNGSIFNKGKIEAVQTTVSPGGLLVGTGEIDGFINNQGGLIVGYSPGTLTIDGNYQQESEGFLEIEIGGMIPDSEHDLLHITGNVTLGGTLKLFFADGFAPQGGNPSIEDDTFGFITVDGSIKGSFSEVIVQGLEEGFQYDITLEGGTVRLTALSNGVPICIDEDGDGYPRYTIPSCPNSNEADCNDTNPDVNPGATDIPNAVDDDCDGNIDGFVATTTIPDECPLNYTDCGNGYCCPPETPVCGEGEDEGLCFEKGGCPVTEIYGQHSKEAEFLRNVRDSVLDSTPEGQKLIKLYYQWSPAVVRAMEEDEEFKQEVKDMIDGVLPMLSH